MLYAVLVLQALLSFLFYISFYSKVLHIRDFYLELYGYGLVPRNLVKTTGSIILLAELIICLGYAAGLWPLARAVLTAAFLAVVTTALLLKNRNNRQSASCQCFGDMEWLNRFPLIRNAALLTGVVIEWFLSARIDTDSAVSGIKMMLLVFVLIGFTIWSSWKSVNARRRTTWLINQWQTALKRSGDLDDGFAHDAILIVKHGTSQFQAIDAELQGKSLNLVVYLQAPAWMIEAKRRVWRHHKVLPYNPFIEEEITQADNLLIRREGRFYRTSRHVLSFLRWGYVYPKGDFT